MRQFFVYILSSRSRNLYIGVTRDLERRLAQHRARPPGFTSKYRIDRLVYWEATESPYAAISREKQIKSYRRSKKIDLIVSMNPTWKDLSIQLGLTADPSLRSG